MNQNQRWQTLVSRKKNKIFLFFLFLLISLLFFLTMSTLINNNNLFSFDRKKYNLSELNNTQSLSQDNQNNKTTIDEYCEIYSDQIDKLTDYKIKNEQDRAKQQSINNKTSFDDEWMVVLSSYNVKNDKELKAKIKDDIKNKYFYNELCNKNYDKFLKNYTYGAFPFHIKEIFINIKEINDNNIKITSDELNKIYNVIDMLDRGSSFETVSYLFNENNSLKVKKANRIVDIFSKHVDENVKNAVFLNLFSPDLNSSSNILKIKNRLIKNIDFSLKKFKANFNVINVDDLEKLIYMHNYVNSYFDDNTIEKYKNEVTNYLFHHDINLISTKKSYRKYRNKYVLYNSNSPVFLVRGKKGIHFITIKHYPILDEFSYFSPYLSNEKEYPKNYKETYVNNNNDNIQIMKNKSNEIKNHIEYYCQFLQYNYDKKQKIIQFDNRLDSIFKEKNKILKDLFKKNFHSAEQKRTYTVLQNKTKKIFKKIIKK